MKSASQKMARCVRESILRMTSHAKAAHVGSCLSVADILAVLYGEVLKVNPLKPAWPDRDRFILSKGHAAAALYAVLAERGFFAKKKLNTFCQNGSSLAGHATHHGVPGVEVSTGSLGHGLGLGCGMALAAQKDKKKNRVFVLISDGECDEGSTWEAALFAAHHRLDRLTVIVDYNKIQSFGSVKDVLGLEPLAQKWRAFGWSVEEVNGHDHTRLAKAFKRLPWKAGKPSCLIAHTVKGKGVSFMENKLAWHYQSLTAEQLLSALDEIHSKS